MALHAVLLDIDGTLLLSNDAHAQSWSDAFADFGYAVPAARIQPLIGMGGDKLMAALVPGLSTEEGKGKEIADRREEVFHQHYAPHLKPAPGSRALVERLRRDNYTVAVASSAKEEELSVLLKHAHVDDLIEAATTSSEAKESKPAPDIVDAALGKIGKAADQVIMIGDTPYDIESAGKLGVGVIAVRCGGHSDSDLANAVAIYDDPADILAHYDQTPLGKRQAMPSRSGAATGQS